MPRDDWRRGHDRDIGRQIRREQATELQYQEIENGSSRPAEAETAAEWLKAHVKKTVRCRACGCVVNAENLKNHKRKVHGLG